MMANSERVGTVSLLQSRGWERHNEYHVLVPVSDEKDGHNNWRFKLTLCSQPFLPGARSAGPYFRLLREEKSQPPRGLLLTTHALPPNTCRLVLPDCRLSPKAR